MTNLLFPIGMAITVTALLIIFLKLSGALTAIVDFILGIFAPNVHKPESPVYIMKSPEPAPKPESHKIESEQRIMQQTIEITSRLKRKTPERSQPSKTSISYRPHP